MKVRFYAGRDKDNEKAITPCLLFCYDDRTSPDWMGFAFALGWWDFSVKVCFLIHKKI